MDDLPTDNETPESLRTLNLPASPQCSFTISSAIAEVWNSSGENAGRIASVISYAGKKGRLHSDGTVRSILASDLFRTLLLKAVDSPDARLAGVGLASKVTR